jgi:TusA-related sulfurtransferase
LQICGAFRKINDPLSKYSGMNMYDKEIDVTGDCCPLPLIHLAEAVREMESGGVLRITGDDPIFTDGVKDFCQAQGHEIVEVVNEARRTLISIRVSA